MHSCTFCQERPFTRRRSGRAFYWSIKYTLGVATQSAFAGCDFFTFCLGPSDATQYLKEETTLEITLAEDRGGDVIYANIIIDGNVRHRLWVWAEPGISYRFNITMLDDLILQIGTAAASIAKSRPLINDPSSEATFGMAQKALLTCHSHKTCEKVPSATPSRLVAIERKGSGPGLKLSIKSGLNERYTALTYCWGGEQPVKLTTSTEEVYMSKGGVPYDALPQTIKDALDTTLRLDLHFLWVDCLCIMQDNDEDMSREITKLPDIFGGAELTISASRARNCQEGFLHLRQPESSPQLQFELPIRSGSAACKSISPLILTSNGSCRFLDIQFEEPIDSRAWTLQERLFSPRILDFGTMRVMWKCRTDTKVDGLSSIESAPQFRSEVEELHIGVVAGAKERAHTVLDPNKDHRNLIAGWHLIRENYTGRKTFIPGR